VPAIFHRFLRAAVQGKVFRSSHRSGNYVRRASAILHDHQNTGLGRRDATILTAVDKHDVTELWTHDADLKRVADGSLDTAVYDPVAES